MTNQINPQIEDGYTKIANELLDAIVLFKFTERQYKVLFALIRKTYGYNKTSDDISLSQLSSYCNLPVNHVSTVIKQLTELNVIIKKSGKYAFNLSVNKHYDKWGLHNMECLNVELQKVDKRVTSLGVLGFHNMEVQNTTPKDNTKDICILALNYLNEKTKRNYKPVKSNIDLVKGRVKEGYTKDDIFRVIDAKCLQWMADEKMSGYLRPATLFNATKFSQYAGEAVQQKSNRDEYL